jgi:hypothetical protein
MEYRPNSRPENSYTLDSVPQDLSTRRSRDIGPPIRTSLGTVDDYDARYTTSRLFQTVTDDHMLYSSILRWREPKFPNHNTHASRLRTYLAWPHLLAPAPERLSAAEFLFTGKHKFEILLFLNQKHIKRILSYTCNFFSLFSGPNDTVQCFVCGGGLKDWNMTDDPFKEHSRWFPYCVYINYIKGQDCVRNCLAQREAYSTTDGSCSLV